LIESELFGHTRGAFTGANRERPGKFAEAGGGTLLLDEIDSLPLAVQAKLLRACEERAFEPVGSNRSVPVRARLIAASNRNLRAEVEAGHFRADLYYRLNVVNFHLPPLRECRPLIPHLATRFIGAFAARNGRFVHGISNAAVRALQEYGWPGNVRELRNVIERVVALCPGPEVQLEDLPERIRQADPPLPLPPEDQAPAVRASIRTATLSDARQEAEAARIREALCKNRNNRLRTAKELGISRMTLYKKLYQYGLLRA
jgi:DNA-binding NtrC family response regulator